jgi:hypothetical protein
MTQQAENQIRRIIATDKSMGAEEREAWLRALADGILSFASAARLEGARGQASAVRLIPLADAARKLGVCYSTVQNMVKDGRLRAVRGEFRCLAIEAASLEPYIVGERPRPRLGHRKADGLPANQGRHFPRRAAK